NAVYQLRRQGAFDETQSQLQLTVGWVDGDVYDPQTKDPTQNSGFLTDFLPFQLPDISIARAGFWDWQFQDQTDGLSTPLAMTADQTITVSIPNLTAFPGLQASDLRLIGYTKTLDWIDLSSTSSLPTPYASGLTKGSTLKGVIPAGTVITAILIGSINDIILPVTFNSFAVKSEGCKALLQWETASEQNNSHFTVERSTDGSTFTAIARVGAMGNSSNLNTYKYTDESPANGINYYRITQVDFDGKHSSTEIKTVKIQCNGGNEALLRVYPNPATNQVYIQTGKPVARVNVLSSNGQTVLKYIPSQTGGGGTFPLNIQRLQRGIYLLQLVNKDGTVNVIKLLKQ
ncbi:MAG TPA: T9SS type A sorting domain-containing protein, partial [Agriterribacter sp.]|nr:T9SS type A sorting domain-containing protein [Agriterribacter sp.]